MSSIKQIQSNIDSHLSMRDLVEVYERMAANTMRKIRDAILASREYYHNLAKLSAEVGADLSSVEEIKSKKSALVLLSSDDGMYGEIMDKVFGRFLKEIKDNSTADVYISGKVGQDLMTVVSPRTKYQSLAVVELDDDSLMATIGETLWKYREVEIFFGQFESIARQEPNSRVLSVNQLESAQDSWAGDAVARLKYLYEPSVEKISDKFSKGIFVGVLQQTIKEDELAKNASRLMHLDKALSEIEKKLGTEQARFGKANKRRVSKKQQLQLAGYKAMSKIRRSYV
jgi:F0F1-type ATP synthase gamma subunit